MPESGLQSLLRGFAVALEWHNFLYCLGGVVIGNIVGVMPGMGVLAAISILLPLTYTMPPVGAVLMLSGLYYGAQYGGAICAILLNLPCHAAHAVTCLDGYPMTLKGKAGTALGLTVGASFVGASFGIILMIFFAPVLVKVALNFGPVEVCSLMLLGLLAGSTLAKGSALKGITMTVFGLLLGIVGIDVNTGIQRFTFDNPHLAGGIELAALAIGLFGVAEFLRTVNNVRPVNLTSSGHVRARDMWPSKGEVKQALVPAVRGTIIGSLCALIPGTGPTIASFIAYAAEKRLSRTPERFGHGAIAGVVAPEASTHSSVQGDFIPTMSLGIPGDAVMALILGALIIQGIQPGPQLINSHPDIFWGLIASFWIGNILLLILNVPMISIWVKLLKIPYKYLFPIAIFFMCMGVYAINNDLVQVSETLVFGLVGYVLLRLDFHAAPVLLGFVLGPRFEEDLRRSLLLSRGSLSVFIESPISVGFLTAAVLLVCVQIYGHFRRRRQASLRTNLSTVTVSENP
jgi:putative tricarboxylic transport membrane protein